jgi:long-chain fatty acid transport protein
LLGAALAGHNALAGGFQLFEQSVKGLGSAFSDQASAGDASTTFWNPAGLTRLTGQHAAVAGQLIKPTGRFANEGTRTFLPPPAGLPMSGGDGGDPSDFTLIPHLYYTHQLSEQWRAGIAINAPFGLATHYDEHWVGRYHALHTELKTMNVNPAVGVRLNRHISVGGGINLQFVRAKLSNAIDFGSVCLAQASAAPALAPLCTAGGFTVPGNADTDGKVSIKGVDWALGWNVGLMLDLAQDTRLGVAYRSRMSHDVKGDAHFTKPANLPVPIALAAPFTNSGMRTRVVLPETVTLAFDTAISDTTHISASSTWTRWSRLQEVRIRFDSGAPDATTPFNWRDSWRIALGTSYRVAPSWTLRAGVAYDASPVKDELRSPRVPDATRRMLGIGATYRVSPASTLDFGYGHWFIRDAPINLNTPAGGHLVGTYRKPYIDVIGVQFNHRIH